MDSKLSLRCTSILSVAFLTIPVFLLGAWIYAFQTNQQLSQAGKVQAFNSSLPGFIANNLAIIGIVTALLAMILASVALRRSKSALRIVNIITFTLAGLMIAWQVFGLM